MTRFVALLLMSLTASALARFLAPAAAAELPILTLGLPLLAIGTLFGLLAIDWHFAWSIPTALVAGTMLYLGSAHPTGPSGEAPGTPAIRWSALAIPPVALLGGSLVGAFLIRRKQRTISEPEAGD